ncbi:hypothetical protein BJY04DRAFT_91922 [Aspergillus karnatakaensis]|uniref:uncharacterized protein n=1 Tax=Aspergillus karnatakaensis TaxID=1810916 RepID=UPI003CCD7315
MMKMVIFYGQGSRRPASEVQSQERISLFRPPRAEKRRSCPGRHVELNVAGSVSSRRSSTLALDSSCREDPSPQGHGRILALCSNNHGRTIVPCRIASILLLSLSGLSKILVSQYGTLDVGSITACLAAKASAYVSPGCGSSDLINQPDGRAVRMVIYLIGPYNGLECSLYRG